MTHSRDQYARADAVEALLERAAPRPVPPTDDERRVRDAVRAEWRGVTGKRRSRRRVVSFALAATVLLAVAVTFDALRVTEIAPVQVAAIGRTHGAVHLLDDNGRYHALADTSAIYAGQAIRTGDDAGIGLAWGAGGSLRVDQQTRIEFVSESSVMLHEGRIYFDSQFMAPDAGFTINTEHGSVTHVGTQYMTESQDDALIVSVREGKVEIDGHYYDHTATEGKQVRISGSARPSTFDLPRHSKLWAWVEAMSPPIQLDGMTTYDFLMWVGRETGLEVHFATAAAENTAKLVEVRGAVNTDPRTALRLRMMTVDLSYEIDGGTIIVSTRQTR